MTSRITPKITFVTFHIDCTPKAAEHIAQENVWLKNRQQYLTQIELLFRSISVFHADCRKVVVTDQITDLAGLPQDIEIHRMDLNSETVMLSRSQAQIEFVRCWGQGSDIIWLDSDMLVNGSLAGVFDGSFDVGATYRTNHEMPINAGILFLAKARPEQTLAFLEFTYQLYQQKYAAQSTWWGDQYALIDAIGAEHLQPGGSDRPRVSSGATVALLPCAIYNFSPENQLWAIAARLGPQRVIHFKGARKRLIGPYWQSYLAPLEQPGWGTAMGLRHRTRLVLSALREQAQLRLGPWKRRLLNQVSDPVGS
jgi:hypothetical protein